MFRADRVIENDAEQVRTVEGVHQVEAGREDEVGFIGNGTGTAVGGVVDELKGLQRDGVFAVEGDLDLGCGPIEEEQDQAQQGIDPGGPYHGG